MQILKTPFTKCAHEHGFKKPIKSGCFHIANVLSPGGLTWSVGMKSVFDSAHLSVDASKT